MCLRPSSAVCLRKTWPQSFTYPRKLRFATCKGSCWKCQHMTKVFRVLLGTFKGANLDKACLQICVAVWSRHHRTLANPCKGVCWTNLAVAHACTKKRSLHSTVVLFNIFSWIEETAAVQWLHLCRFDSAWVGLSPETIYIIFRLAIPAKSGWILSFLRLALWNRTTAVKRCPTMYLCPRLLCQWWVVVVLPLSLVAERCRKYKR